MKKIAILKGLSIKICLILKKSYNNNNKAVNIENNIIYLHYNSKKFFYQMLRKITFS